MYWWRGVLDENGRGSRLRLLCFNREFTAPFLLLSKSQENTAGHLHARLLVNQLSGLPDSRFQAILKC